MTHKHLKKKSQKLKFKQRKHPHHKVTTNTDEYFDKKIQT